MRTKTPGPSFGKMADDPTAELRVYEKGVEMANDLVKTVREVLEEHPACAPDGGARVVLTRELVCRLLHDGWRK